MASSATYSGSLQTKKKAELQEIAQALDLSDSGTRDELQQRIKKHLDANMRNLEDDPTFSGLINAGRRRGRSVQLGQSSEASFATTGKSSALDVIKERDDTPPPLQEMRDVSMMLPRAPLSPSQSPVAPSLSSTPARNKKNALMRSPPGIPTPSSLPPLPPSPAKSIIADALAQPEVQAVVAMERSFMQGVWQLLASTRSLLSNGTNIFILTAVFDFFAILATIHQDAPFPIPPITADVPPTLRVMGMSSFQWAIPSVFLPLLAGYTISFVAAPGSGLFDPLTASIIRLAGNFMYKFPSVPINANIDEFHSLDVLGMKWRVFSASMTLAFTYAEAIGRAGWGRGARYPEPPFQTPVGRTPRGAIELEG